MNQSKGGTNWHLQVKDNFLVERLAKFWRGENGDGTQVFWEIRVEYWRRDQFLSHFWKNGRLFIIWVVWGGPWGVATSNSNSLGSAGAPYFITFVRRCGRIMTFQTKKWKGQHFREIVFESWHFYSNFFRKIVIPRIS